jgi:primosomal protein N' (replication factor Y)
MPTSCAKCLQQQLVELGRGTERLERDLAACFPKARIARLDRDVARSRQRLADVTTATNAGEVDILIGTQLVAKGWDVPRLQLVVVLESDQSLFAPDIRAHERTVQLLWQVAGRAGRRQEKGLVLIETHVPDHPVLQAVVSHDFTQFAATELASRERLRLPPTTRAATVMSGTRTASKAAADIADIRETLVDALATTPALNEATTVLPLHEVRRPRAGRTLAFAILSSRLNDVLALLPTQALVDVDPESL